MNYPREPERDHDEEEQRAFLSSPSDTTTISPQEPQRVRASNWWRLVLELIMALVIAILLAREIEVKKPVPEFPRKIYTFRPNTTFIKDDMLFSESETLETLHAWLPLSSEARGYVQIPNHESHPLLSDPYTVPLDRVRDGPAYMMSVFHQLHCLSYLIQHYQHGYAGANLTDEVAHHSTHCFDYLRQSIMCAGDTNLEGHTDAGPGWGSRHECVDYDALLAWANAHAAMKWRNGLLPGTAIL